MMDPRPRGARGVHNEQLKKKNKEEKKRCIDGCCPIFFPSIEPDGDDDDEDDDGKDSAELFSRKMRDNRALCLFCRAIASEVPPPLSFPFSSSFFPPSRKTQKASVRTGVKRGKSCM